VVLPASGWEMMAKVRRWAIESVKFGMVLDGDRNKPQRLALFSFQDQ